MIVVLETRALAKAAFARELMEWVELMRRRICRVVAVRIDPRMSDPAPWSARIHVKPPAGRRRLVAAVDRTYTKELSAAIARARAVLSVLTPAWLASPACRSELRHARAADRRRVWLRCGPAKPPGSAAREETIDLRARVRDAGLDALELSLYPSRSRGRARSRCAS